MRELRSLLAAVAADWVALMSGVASVALWVAGALTADANLAYKLLWPIAAACLCLAFYRVWRTQFCELEAARAANTPDLRAEIVQTMWHDTAERPGCGLLLWVDVRNLGAESIADRYAVAVTTKASAVLHPNLHALPQTITLPTGLTLSGKDALYDKTASPVARGAKVVGLLWAWFDNARQADLRGSTVTLTFHDIRGTRCSTTYEPKGTGGGPMMHIPGTALPTPTKKRPERPLDGPAGRRSRRSPKRGR